MLTQGFGVCGRVRCGALDLLRGTGTGGASRITGVSVTPGEHDSRDDTDGADHQEQREMRPGGSPGLGMPRMVPAGSVARLRTRRGRSRSG